MTEPAEIFDALREEVGTVLIGNEEVVEALTISLLTGGHVLLEGVPGVAKTTIAKLFAGALGLDVTRIQMTPDLLPADITGTQIYRESIEDFELKYGPIFANVVLADEINRAPPKTQSALLEAMEEETVTIGGETCPLPDPFMVIATQNPIEVAGTYRLPEAQRDRFQFKLTVELPAEQAELELLDRFDVAPDLGPARVTPVVSLNDLLTARQAVVDVYVDESVKRYIRNVVAGTRTDPNVEYGGSPRATLAFLNTSKARATLHGRDYVIPDDVKALARPILAHRLVLNTDAELNDVSAEMVVETVLDTITPPGGPADGTEAETEDISTNGGDTDTDATD
ncbi:MoxR family ATPase [Haladaptatus sp. DYSN1]|uniref:AAA family ATPase n=1 Tax=unclassified Haladaptatus TaxID=2622732 RepID=UPI002404B20F|nr:MoxR family ATPase [Haladaptatus sp. DYSN1]